ncbi:MAG TPA: lysylphosphatidylglycerol synthase domain-containing protein [Saprospiraceae bacterium]|nr:lysylphosphatidylglycerol synthase domain-containing protein [Saprospiraceae bacterium]HRG20427.1 lysylphosphatidylglycerol synthase domain-containing protein [Saprospiraceae bacterium]
MLDNALILVKKNLWFLSGKLLLIGVLSWLIYDRIWVQQVETGYFDHLYKVLSGGQLGWLIACLLLAPINWLLEVIKWKQLTSPFQRLSWKEASQSILAGISLGLLTPARFGEYGGRLLHSSAGHRASTLYAHFIGSLSQNIPVFLFGSMAVAWYFSQFYIANTLMALSIAFVLLSAAILMILLFMQHHSLAMWMSRFKWLKEIKSVQKEVNYTPRILHNVALLSLFRFLIFVSQYLTLLYLFDLPIEWWQATMGVFVIFVFQSGLPLPPVLGIVARTQLSVVVWSVFAQDQLSMLTVPLLLYTINLLFPAVIGGIILIGTNYQRQIDHE